ncbi:hypothetical protein D1006_14780 [Burkholderia stabilis]|uniref:Uncharacterized protein n=1 Tax=Burkholderia stabilis TaxID=95485 RepID=A0A4Q2AV41_9BURK|nr:hypothetical protein [Burkholderia stabilis]RXV73470.1 hypothetical protein D1006_14780 [Burkholderia stabilis]
MRQFLITYDLKTKNEDNDQVRQVLTDLNAEHLMKSVWLIDDEDDVRTARNIFETIWTHLKVGDELLVTMIDSSDAYSGRKDEVPTPIEPSNRYVEKIKESGLGAAGRLLASRKGETE